MKQDHQEKQENQNFKPYIAPDQKPAEMTWLTIVLGVLLAVVFGAANAYLGLRVGMTVSASIPAAVISMGVIRMVLRRESVLECNMVQTIGSAGESLAAGAIFTMPALFLWAKEGIMEKPGIGEITLIALCGGALGVLFMVPLRRALIVKEHGRLPYPEGTACAEVLLAGEKKGSGAAAVFWGMGFGGLIKFLVDGLRVVPAAITIRIRGLYTECASEIYPALAGVGFICGPKIAAYMLAGGILGWLVLIPAITSFGEHTIMFPGVVTLGELYVQEGASGIWSTYIRYIGAGAVAAGGAISLVKSLPLIIRTFKEAVSGLGQQGSRNTLRTERDLDLRWILGGVAVLILVIWWTPVIPVNLVGGIFIVVLGFFFAAVSSRMVGLVGSSNNPVSGMAIATLLLASLILKLAGEAGSYGMRGAIAIGSVICIVACMAGDTSQDLKTGYLLGATPKTQQLGELLGILCASAAIGGVLYLLDAAWGFGSQELAAPQATLMKLLVEGVMEGNLPWILIGIGVCVALAIEVLRVPVLPVAIGLYLPFALTACIMLGALTRLVADQWGKASVNRGILFSSGMIAGEGLLGILLALLAVGALDQHLNMSEYVYFGAFGSIAVLAILLGGMLLVTYKGGKQR